MSAEEDTELRDLVAQTLEANGVLGKIRAQLRASVFLALEEQENVKNKTPLRNIELQKFLSTSEGCQVVSLVREFLQFFNLEYTLAVFDPEICCMPDKLECNRTALGREMNVVDAAYTSELPLLSAVVQQCKDKTRGHRISLAETLSPQLVSAARYKFEQYDEDRNGQIDKDELRQLFCDLFPSFHRNMLDRYVNDEFRSADKDFSSGIDFEEFLAIYKRIFVLCKSSIANEVNDTTNQSPQLLPEHMNKNNDSSVNAKSTVQESKNASKSVAVSNMPKADVLEVHKDSGSDVDNDPFFDDTPPKKGKQWEWKEDPKLASAGNKAGNTCMSSLAGFPSLSGSGRVMTSVNAAKDEGKKDKLLDLEPDDDKYDDDFQESNISPIGQTPRSARSDKVQKSLENDEIDEEIEEELSVGEDLLKSEASANDDLTTDRTLSPAEQSTAADYVEDVLHP